MYLDSAYKFINKSIIYITNKSIIYILQVCRMIFIIIIAYQICINYFLFLNVRINNKSSKERAEQSHFLLSQIHPRPDSAKSVSQAPGTNALLGYATQVSDLSKIE